VSTNAANTDFRAPVKPARRLAATLAVVALLAALGAGGASAAVSQWAYSPAYGADASWSS
jgi:hypothetical protein